MDDKFQGLILPWGCALFVLREANFQFEQWGNLANASALRRTFLSRAKPGKTCPSVTNDLWPDVPGLLDRVRGVFK